MQNKIQPKLTADPAAQSPSGSYRAPTADDFKGSAVTAEVLKQSAQHPATIYPLAGSALSLAWSLMIAPSPISIGAGLGLAFVGASSFIYNYVVKGPQLAETYVRVMRSRRRMALSDSLTALGLQFHHEGVSDGVKEARDLKDSYDELAKFLNANDKVTSVDRFSVLAEDSLRQGVHTLEQALAVIRAMKSINVNALRNELADLNRQFKNAKTPALGDSIKRQIDAHTHTIDLYQHSLEKLFQLFAECNDIEAALRASYLELVDLGNDDFDTYLRQDGGAVVRLNQAVQAARRVEQRLRGEEDPEQAERKNKYIEMAQKETDSSQH